MKILTFLQTFASYPVFSTLDIEKRFPGFERENLLGWQDKGYIERVRNGWYRVKQTPLSEIDSYFVSNKIYHPSYVSLESAFAHYGWIPEAVLTTIALSTKKTTAFHTPIGHFHYQKIKPALFFGYRILKTTAGFGVKIAEPEKALLDYLYLNPQIKDIADLEAMRFNTLQMQSELSKEKLISYASLFHSKAVAQRLLLFQDFLTHAQSF
jgi:predicted transcriptional regulator of viral defense system